MKSILSHRLTWIKIVESVLLILCGVLVAVLGGYYDNTMPHAITICLSVFLLADGLITLLEFWLEAKKNFTISSVIGALFLATGVLLAIFAAEGTKNDLAYTIAKFISILILAFAFIFLVKAIIQTIYKGPVGWIVIHYLIAAGAIALGTCSIIYINDAIVIVLIVLGIAIAVLGSIDLLFAIINYRKDLAKRKEAGKKEPETVKVDAELDGDKVVKKGSKSKKKLTNKKQKEVKQIENKPLEIEDKKQEKADKKVEKANDEKSDDVKNDTKDEEPIVGEVVDPTPEK